MTGRIGQRRIDVAIVSDDGRTRELLAAELAGHGFGVSAVARVDDLSGVDPVEVVVIDATRSLRVAAATAAEVEAATGARVLLISEHIDRALDWGVRVVPHDPSVALLAREISRVVRLG